MNARRLCNRFVGGRLRFSLTPWSKFVRTPSAGSGPADPQQKDLGPAPIVVSAEVLGRSSDYVLRRENTRGNALEDLTRAAGELWQSIDLNQSD